MIEVTLAECIQAGVETALGDLHTALPGRVVSYDATKGLAVVEACVALPLPAEDDAIVYDPFPQFADVPVAFPSGGGMLVAWNLAAGDPCTILFSELACPHYLLDGEIENPTDTRRHSLGYPTVLPGGWRPDAKKLHSLPSSGIVIGAESGDALVTIDAGVITLGRNATNHVALAELVATELGKIATAFSTFIPGSGGASFPQAYTAPSSVASTVTKAK